MQAIGRLGKIPLWQDLSTSANHISISPQPAITAYQSPLFFAVRVANTNTSNSDFSASTLGAVQILRPTGSTLNPADMVANGISIFSYDGSHFQLLNPMAAQAAISSVSLFHWGVESGVPNHVVITLPPLDAIGSSWPTPLLLACIMSTTNNGATNMQLNTFPNVNVTRGGSNQLQPGDLVTGGIALFCFDGAEAQLLNPQTVVGQPFAPAAREITNSGPFNMANSDYRLIFNRTANLSPSSTTLPPNAYTGQEFVFKDIVGNARPYPISAVPPTNHVLENIANNIAVLNIDRGSMRIAFNGFPTGVGLWTIDF